jgi:hypothetical protein
MDADDLARKVTPAAEAAVAAFRFGALTREPDEHGDPSREVGCGILQAVYWRTAQAPQLEGAVNDLASRPDDPDAVAALRLQLAKALEADAELARQVEALLVGGVGALAAQNADENVDGNASASSDSSAAESADASTAEPDPAAGGAG